MDSLRHGFRLLRLSDTTMIPSVSFIALWTAHGERSEVAAPWSEILLTYVTIRILSTSKSSANRLPHSNFNLSNLSMYQDASLLGCWG
nr:hypothetical protein Iba_chr02aCG3210 [Ipomoea batatas]GMC67456.1 hypothetical protein Iba_chr02fCG2650 [Ipomoea batatas]